jgi:hypothetical protein
MVDDTKISSASNCGKSKTDGTKKKFLNNRNNSRDHDFKPGRKNKDKFKGKCKDLEGFVFDANRYNQADEFMKTLNEIIDYVGANYENGDDVRAAIEVGTKPEISKPVKPEARGGKIDETDELIWKCEIDCYVRRKATLDSNLRKAFSLVWGQCTDIMREKLEALPNFANIKSEFDVLALLKEMKTINFKFEDQKYPYGSVYFAMKRFCTYRQTDQDTNNQHYDKFNNIVNVLDSYGIMLGQEDMLLESDQVYSSLNDTQKKKEENIVQARKRNRERFLAFCFIVKSDNGRYQDLKTDLENDYTKGMN